MKFLLAVLFSLALTLPSWSAQAATTITSNQTGFHDGYDYELWKDHGNTSMTLNSGGAFSGITLGMRYSEKERNSTQPNLTHNLETYRFIITQPSIQAEIPVCVCMDGRRTRSLNITSSTIGAPIDRPECQRGLLLLMGAHMTFMKRLESTNLLL